MGHSRIGTLPASKQWKEVVRLISEGANVAAVAEKTLVAAQKALLATKGDPGFREAAHLLAQLGAAAKAVDPAAHLEGLGIELRDGYSTLDLATALSEAVDRRMEGRNQRHDWGEMAKAALVTAVTKALNNGDGALFEPSRQDLNADLKGLRTERGFGALGRAFFAAMSEKVLNYFLTKTLGSHVGQGQRFPSMKEFTEFRKAMSTHNGEASQIVEKFSGQWLVKQFRENPTGITREAAEGFGAHAIHKMQLELAARAGRNGS